METIKEKREREKEWVEWKEKDAGVDKRRQNNVYGTMKILVNRTLRIKPSDNVMNYSKNSVIRFPFQNAMISSFVEL